MGNPIFHFLSCIQLLEGLTILKMGMIEALLTTVILIRLCPEVSGSTSIARFTEVQNATIIAADAEIKVCV